MLPSVQSNLLDFLGTFEGRGVKHPYIDRLGYVTTGIGYLANSLDAMQRIPWQNPDGSRSDPAQIADAFNALVALRTRDVGQEQIGSIAEQGGNSKAMQEVTNIRITQSVVDDLAMARALEFEKTLRPHFPAWDSFPADGQMLMMSMAWALGPAFAAGFPSFTRDVNSGDFESARAQDTWRNENADRKAANDLLASNAAGVIRANADTSVLYWPSAFTGGSRGSATKTGLIAALFGVAGYVAYRMIKS